MRYIVFCWFVVESFADSDIMFSFFGCERNVEYSLTALRPHHTRGANVNLKPVLRQKPRKTQNARSLRRAAPSRVHAVVRQLLGVNKRSFLSTRSANKIKHHKERLRW